MKIETINATVFEPKKEDGRKDTVIANISTYEGKNQNDKARYCSWRTRFVGEAYEKTNNSNFFTTMFPLLFLFL